MGECERCVMLGGATEGVLAARTQADAAASGMPAVQEPPERTGSARPRSGRIMDAVRAS